jgi:hypothetical protein
MARCDWAPMFKTMPARQAFHDDVGPLREREAYRRANARDMALMPTHD